MIQIKNLEEMEAQMVKKGIGFTDIQALRNEPLTRLARLFGSD